jgi:DNA-binding NarL/FixJ family response regulator
MKRSVFAPVAFPQQAAIVGMGRADRSPRRAQQPRAIHGRQAAVVEPCVGKANKIIAYELKCGKHRKVHVHNIMKKLNAKNRTGCLITNQMA